MSKLLAAVLFLFLVNLSFAENDTAAPVISSVSVSSATYNSAVISWLTDEASTTQVEYGATASYGSAQQDASLVTSHLINLAGLASSMVYHFRVKSTDNASNTAISDDYNFTTAQAPDTSPPTIGSVLPATAAPNKTVAFTAAAADNVGIVSCKLIKDSQDLTATYSAGTAGYTFPSGLADGTYTMRFECTDAAGNIGTGQSTTIAVEKPKLNIEITTEKSAYYPQESIEPRAKVTDAAGKIITDAAVKGNLSLDNKTYGLYFFYSSLCDCYKSSYWLGESMLVGKYTILSEATKADYQKAAASRTFDLVKPTISAFIVQADKSEYSPGESMQLTITMKDSLGNYITDAYITGEIRDATTESLINLIYPYKKGDAYIYSYWLGSESLDKSYKISVSTKWKEQKASASATISVLKKGLNADVVFEKNVLSPGDYLRGKIKVYDKTGSIVKDASVSVEVQSPKGFVNKHLMAEFKDDVYEIEKWKVDDWAEGGEYTVKIQIKSGQESIDKEKSFTVAKKKLNVDISLDQTSYKPDERMYIKVLVTDPNGTVVSDAYVSGEVFPLLKEETLITGAATEIKGELVQDIHLCRLYPNFLKPLFYKGEFVQKYYIDTLYIPTYCPTGKYVLKLKVSLQGYDETEVIKEFEIALAKLFIEAGARVDSRQDSANIRIYAEVKDERGGILEFATVSGAIRPSGELLGCIKRVDLYYDSFAKRYYGDIYANKYECQQGVYNLQLEASKPSYETAEVVQEIKIQYILGSEFITVVAPGASPSVCRETSCGPGCIQNVCEPETSAGECFELKTDKSCIEDCTRSLSEVEKAIAEGKAIDLKACINSCAVRVPCKGYGLPAVSLEEMTKKLGELRKEIEQTEEQVGFLKQLLLAIIDFINSILSKYIGEIAVPAENATAGMPQVETQIPTLNVTNVSG